MSEIRRNAESFIAYDYKEVKANTSMEPIVADGLHSFGWELDTAVAPKGLGSVSLRFKRDRKIRNKAELSRLQHQFEIGVAEIEELERSKTRSASVAAFTVGIVGCAFLAGSVSTFMADMIPAMILLAIPGFVCWALPYPLFVKLRQRRATTVTPVIESKYDELFEICKSSSSLLTTQDA
jgi:hypothetical protein